MEKCRQHAISGCHKCKSLPALMLAQNLYLKRGYEPRVVQGHITVEFGAWRAICETYSLPMKETAPPALCGLLLDCNVRWVDKNIGAVARCKDCRNKLRELQKET